MSEKEGEIMVLSAAEQANIKAIMKATEDLVTKARLDQIAREHKSMGAILDDRVLYKIDEPAKRVRSQTFKTALQLQREKELQDEALAKEAYDQKLMNEAAKLLKKQNDYTTEMQIWKEKSGPAAYSQVRRFQYPELQKFKDGLTHEQQIIFRKRCNTALMLLADKYREECKEMKTDMDLNGVFHPEANAHRIHCIYLMKLYKGIRSDTIEDPILRQMKSEEEKRIAHEKALQLQKQELLRSMEAAEKAKMTPAQQEAAQALEDAKRREQADSEIDVHAPESATLDGSVDGNNTAANSVATGNPSANLNVVIPSITPKAGTTTATATPGNSKGNTVQFARMGSMRSVRTASEKSAVSEKEAGSDKAGFASSSASGKLRTPKGTSLGGRGALVRNSNARGLGAKTDAVEPSAGSSKRNATASSAHAATTATTPTAGSKAALKSASMPALSGESAEGGNNTSTGGFAASASSGKLPPIIEPGSEQRPAAAVTPKANAGEVKSSTNNANSDSNRGMRRSSHSKSAPAFAGGGRRRVMSGISEDLNDPSSVGSAAERQGSPEKDRGQKGPDKLFKKIKANKLGGAEPRTLLTEEAGKLESAESFTLKKTRDKNNILDTEVTDWMLSSVQKTQIGKTSTGTAMLTTGGLSMPPKLSANALVTEFNDAIKRTSTSPTKMLPFDQFHTMFEEYTKIHSKPEPADAAQTVASGSLPGGKSAENSSGTNPTKKARQRRRQTEGNVMHHDTGSLASSLDEDGASYANRSRASILAGELGIARANRVEPTNLVKTLAEQDANFEAYLKLVQHQEHPKDSDTQAKFRSKLNAAITAPRRIRKPNPLGQSAVHLVDSRGRESKDAKRGFSNIFLTKLGGEEAGAAGDGSAASQGKKAGGIRIDARVSIMGTDNIMGRLNRMDEEEASHFSASSANNEAPASPGTPTQERNDADFGSTDGPPSPHADAKDRFKGNRQNSRSRRRFMSSDSFRSGSDPSTPTARGSAKAGKLAGEDDDEGFIAEPTPDQGMQDKLVAAWDCLQMPAAQRFGFMQKYSTDEYSMEMGRAVDMWAECAVLVVCVIELNKVLSKLKAGTCVMPLSRNFILRSIRNKVPPLLASASAFFIPPSLGYYDAQVSHQTVPLSAEALNKVESFIVHAFSAHGEPLEAGRRGLGVYDAAQSLAIVSELLNETATLLKAALKTVHSELADVVPYGGRGCKEWVFAITGIGRNGALGTLSTAAGEEEFE